MNDRLKLFFEEQLLPAENADAYTRAVGIQYATAALLIEVAKADNDQDELERAVINAMLRDTFDLSDEMLEQILELADDATSDTTDVYQFTTMVNDHYDYDNKLKLVEYLWMVAFADGRLDHYEEQFVSKVAGLLHVAEDDLTQAKLTAQENVT